MGSFFDLMTTRPIHSLHWILSPWVCPLTSLTPPPLDGCGKGLPGEGRVSLRPRVPQEAPADQRAQGLMGPTLPSPAPLTFLCKLF